MHVYLISTPDGRHYVGQTCFRPEHRWSEHRSLLRKGRHPNVRLQQAWRDGLVPTFRSVATAQTLEQLNALERQIIRTLQATDPRYGYNIGSGGRGAGGMTGRRHSPEAREKMRAAQRGRRHPPEVREKMAESRRRLWEKPTGKMAAYMERHRRIPRPPVPRAEINARISAALKGKPKSAAHRAALSAARKRRAI